ncbi:hypothetical protein U9M48_042209 [Paspalum notatum var. saurae]|uniref:Reverse transcriptase domain-containing protein n=1 Tax=Paspalum notatum var. saurae TaxID=547442 RepID=A0AAQ3USE5_PASNO
MQKHQIDVICLQETMVTKISDSLTRSIGRGGNFSWTWSLADGHSGGLLVGVNEDKFSVVNACQGRRYQYLILKEESSAECWGVMNVYGPVKDAEKSDFLKDIKDKILNDSSGLIVGDTQLRELCRNGSRYTWSNNQTLPVMVVLDRVFVSNSWEAKFPLVSLRALTKVGSDHTSLLVRTGEQNIKVEKIFRFEPSWMLVEGFKEEVMKTWIVRGDEYVLNYWKNLMTGLRKFMKGWSMNVGRGETRKKKDCLIQSIKQLDDLAGVQTLTVEKWQERYNMEKQIMEIYEREEVSWQRRGGENWLLKGDNNTSYFHGIANGRKRRCMIRKVIDDDGSKLEDEKSIREHVDLFYKKLFGSEPEPTIKLGEGIFKKASEEGFVKGLVPDLVEGGLTHLQYADDTILFLSDLEEEYRNVKFLLFCFEELSGMRINYSKSEVFPIGLEEVEKRRVADLFHCKMGLFPMKYLGIPIGDRRLSKAEMMALVDKVMGYVQDWMKLQMATEELQGDADRMKALIESW